MAGYLKEGPMPRYLCAFATALLLASLAVATKPTEAQPPTMEFKAAPTLNPLQSVPLRKEPPSGWFLQPGAQIDTLEPDQLYKALSEHDVQGLFYVDKWVQVAPLRPDGSVDLSGSGWAYWGRGDQSVNFGEMKIAPTKEDQVM